MIPSEKFEQEMMQYKNADTKELFGTLKFLDNLKIPQIAVSYQAKKQYVNFRTFIRDHVETSLHFSDYYDDERNQEEFKKDSFLDYWKQTKNNEYHSMKEIMQKAEESVYSFCKVANYPLDRMIHKIDQTSIGYLRLKDARTLVEKTLCSYLKEKVHFSLSDIEDKKKIAAALEKKENKYLHFLYAAAYYEMTIAIEWKRRSEFSKKLREKMESSSQNELSADVEVLAELTASLVSNTYEEIYTLYLMMETLNYKCILQFVELIEFLNLNYIGNKTEEYYPGMFDIQNFLVEKEWSGDVDKIFDKALKEKHKEEEQLIQKRAINSRIHILENKYQIQFSMPMTRNKNGKAYYEYLEEYFCKASSFANTNSSDARTSIEYLQEYLAGILDQNKSKVNEKSRIKLVRDMADKLGWNYREDDPKHNEILKNLMAKRAKEKQSNENES